MIPEGEILGSGLEDANDIKELASEARAYLESHKWCHRVEKLYFERGFCYLSVFLAHIDPLQEAGPEQWVVVGDLPPAYLDKRDCANGAQALCAYVWCRQEWLTAYRSGRDLSELMPVEPRRSGRLLEPSEETADLLERRIRLILRMLRLDWFDDIGDWGEDLEELFGPDWGIHPSA